MFVWGPSTSDKEDGYELRRPRLPLVEKIADQHGLLGNRFGEQCGHVVAAADWNCFVVGERRAEDLPTLVERLLRHCGGTLT